MTRTLVNSARSTRAPSPPLARSASRWAGAAMLAVLGFGSIGIASSAEAQAPLPNVVAPPSGSQINGSINAQVTYGQQPYGQQQARIYDSAELDRIVSPIALYPDPLLAQVFAAAMYSRDIPDAAQYANNHQGIRGEELADVMADDQVPWNPSVQALVAFPTVLSMMASAMPWTEEIGEAFQAQRADVMDAVQRMRREAQRYGYLQSNSYLRVSNGPYIEIAPVSPDYWVVPYYDPYVVFYAPRSRFILSTAINFGYGVRLGIWYEPWGYGYTGFRWNTHYAVYDYPGWNRPRTWYRTAYYQDYSRNHVYVRNAGRSYGGQYTSHYGDNRGGNYGYNNGNNRGGNNGRNDGNNGNNGNNRGGNTGRDDHRDNVPVIRGVADPRGYRVTGTPDRSGQRDVQRESPRDNGGRVAQPQGYRIDPVTTEQRRAPQREQPVYRAPEVVRGPEVYRGNGRNAVERAPRQEAPAPQRMEQRGGGDRGPAVQRGGGEQRGGGQSQGGGNRGGNGGGKGNGRGGGRNR